MDSPKILPSTSSTPTYFYKDVTSPTDNSREENKPIKSIDELNTDEIAKGDESYTWSLYTVGSATSTLHW